MSATAEVSTPASEMTLAGALNAGLRRAMADDDRVVVLGEDVATLGGVFRVTDGLSAEFGAARVMDTPLAESGIVGTAIGLAMRGFRPVCEIQFDGFAYPAFDQIVSQLAKLRARSGGRLTVPVVVRIPSGGGIGAVEHHSESNEAYFAHTAGLRVVSCSSPHDAFHMIRAAIASDDPVVFHEPKRRYWDRGDVLPEPDLRLHQARVVRAGSDVSLVAHGPTVKLAQQVAAAAAEDGVDIEVVDLRSISPLDTATLEATARRTGRVVVVHEASSFLGIGAEIAAQVSERCHGALRAPVLRVGAFDLPYPPSMVEDDFLPGIDRVLDAIERSLHY